MSDKKNRSFSKRMVIANCAAAWIVIVLSIWLNVSEAVTGPAFALIGAIVAGYMGVGHLDYRSVLQSEKDDDRTAK